MSNFAQLCESNDAKFLVRWRGRQDGPLSASVIEAKLMANEIGLLHEIWHNGQWITIRDYISGREAILVAEQQARDLHERRAREDAERRTREQEEQRRADALADDRRRATQLEALQTKQAQEQVTNNPADQTSGGGSSALFVFGMLLLIGGLGLTGYFFLAFNTSVESGVGRVNNIGLLADRQNGIIIGIGISLVGAIMVAFGARNKN